MSNYLEGTPSCIEWDIKGFDAESGEMVYHFNDTNLVVRGGRQNVLRNFLGLAQLASSYIFCGIGSGSTAAAVTQTALVTELFNSQSTTRLPFTNTSGAALSTTDIVQETITVSGYDFDQKVVMQATAGINDFNGYNFREYACMASNLFSSVTMANRIVASSDLAKTASLSVVIQVTIRT